MIMLVVLKINKSVFKKIVIHFHAFFRDRKQCMWTWRPSQTWLCSHVSISLIKWLMAQCVRHFRRQCSLCIWLKLYIAFSQMWSTLELVKVALRGFSNGLLSKQWMKWKSLLTWHLCGPSPLAAGQLLIFRYANIMYCMSSLESKSPKLKPARLWSEAQSAVGVSVKGTNGDRRTFWKDLLRSLLAPLKSHQTRGSSSSLPNLRKEGRFGGELETTLFSAEIKETAGAEEGSRIEAGVREVRWESDRQEWKGVGRDEQMD